jgi:hypothetical protein
MCGRYQKSYLLKFVDNNLIEYGTKDILYLSLFVLSRIGLLLLEEKVTLFDGGWSLSFMIVLIFLKQLLLDIFKNLSA